MAAHFLVSAALTFRDFVPISLLVTLEIVKFMQAVFISWDATIYDEAKDMPTKVQSSNLNEELGQVEYIFSDKTGTLTQNIMEFKKMCVGQYSYGRDDAQSAASRSDSIGVGSSSFDVEAPKPDVGQCDAAKRGISNVNFVDPTLFEHMHDASHPNNANIRRFMLHLALCHTVIAEVKDKDGRPTVEYNAR